MFGYRISAALWRIDEWVHATGRGGNWFCRFYGHFVSRDSRPDR